MYFKMFLFFVLPFQLAMQAQPWQNISLPFNGNVFDVHFWSADSGIVAGGSIDAGIILRTTDGGLSWSNVSPEGIKLVYTLQSMADSLLFTTGYDGQIWRSSNKGLLWTPLSTGTQNWLNAACVPDGKRLIAAGLNGTIIRTSSSGNFWFSQNAGTENWILGIHFFTPEFGFACGTNDLLIKTTNGGQSWEKIQAPAVGSLSGVWMKSQEKVHIISKLGFLISSSNAGQTWSTRSISTLALNKIWYHSNQNGFIVGNRALFETQNGGETWVDILENAPGIIDYLGIHYSPDGHLFVCGREGTLLTRKPLLSDSNPSHFTQSIYPNPASDWIQIDSPEAITSWTLKNAAGTPLFKQQTSSSALIIHRNDLPAGLYFIETNSLSGNYIQKIIWE
jgi:photosystem II stability/assembly factor-like uncharacterized protein